MRQKKQNKVNTIQEVAAQTGLSVATISRVMNHHPYVKEETRKKVLEVIEKLGYQKNNIASGLRSNKTNTIGMIVPRISMFFHAEIITTVQNLLYKHGYSLTICQSNDSLQMEQALVKTLLSMKVDAVIAACTLQTVDCKAFHQVMASGIPLLYYDRVPDDNKGAFIVKGDDVLGGFLAASHLIEAGCKKIAHISGPRNCNLYRDRLIGFKQAMKQADLTVHKNWQFHQELTVENAKRSIQKLFESDDSKQDMEVPDGILCDNDTTAIVAMEYARSNHIVVPEELKIVGYSNDPRSSIIRPSITTIEQFPNLMGEKIVSVLMNALQHPALMDGNDNMEANVLPVQLVKRSSTTLN